MHPASTVSQIPSAENCANPPTKSARTVYQAPHEILSLHNEVSERNSFIYLASRHSVGRNILFNVQTLFEEVADLAAVLCREDDYGPGYFERVVWRCRKPTVNRLKEVLSVVR